MTENRFELFESFLVEAPMVALVDAAQIEKWSEWKAIKKSLQDARVKISKKKNEIGTNKIFTTDGAAENRLENSTDWKKTKTDIRRAQDTARMSFNREVRFSNSNFEAEISIGAAGMKGNTIVLFVPPAKAPR